MKRAEPLHPPLMTEKTGSPVYGVIDKCRICSSGGLVPILSLGDMPLVNSLLSSESLTSPEPRYPLDLVFCPSCSLVQITATVPPEDLFREYLYFSSYSDTMLTHARGIAEHLIRERHLGENNLVVEIASNDGYLLQFFVREGVPVLGIEPARNVAKTAEEQKGVPTLAEFFTRDLAYHLREQGRTADVILANNVLAHVADLNGMVEGIRLLLKDNGVAVIETPYVKEMLDKKEFDTIYHEHLCYYSLTALDRLFRQHGMVIADVERLSIHGGSLRVFVTHPSAVWNLGKVQGMLAEEKEWGVLDPGIYTCFAEQIEGMKTGLTSLLRDIKSQGNRIAAYGAAAKGCVLLQTFGISKDTIDYVVDRNIHKQGRYMPGSRIEIRNPLLLLEDMPDYVLLLTWNIADEILEQQAEYRRRGGRFIIPIPEVKVV